MHNKFCVIDQKLVWNGSYNLTTNRTQRNENNALEFRSIKLARIFLREFNEMFVDRRFGITSPLNAGGTNYRFRRPKNRSILRSRR